MGAHKTSSKSLSSLASKSDPSLLDVDKVPTELSTHGKPVPVQTILDLSPGEEYEFHYGEYIPNAVSFNQYLEANVRPGDSLKLERNSCLTMIKRLSDSLNTGGLAALPQVCTGKECSRYATCTLQLASIPLPIGGPCALEKVEILNHVRRLASDFGEHRSYADQLLIQGVAGLEVLKSRAMAHLSKESSVVVDVVRGIDNQGNVIKAKEANPAFEIVNKITKNELMLLKALSMTAADRLKREDNKAISVDAQAASYRRKLSELKMNMDKMKDSGVQDAVYTILEDVEVKDTNGEDLPGLEENSRLVAKARSIENINKIEEDLSEVHIRDRRGCRVGEGAKGTTSRSEDLPHAGDKSKGPSPLGGETENSSSSERTGNGVGRDRKYQHAAGESPFLRGRESNVKPKPSGDDDSLEEIL